MTRELDRALTGYMRDFARMMTNAKARHDFFYSSIFDLYLKEGVLANPEPYTADEERHLLKVFRSFMKAPAQKVCFYNAQTLALGEELLYAEGQVLHSDLPIPIEHGWNLLPSGKAVDVTLRKKGEPNTCDPRKLLARAISNQKNAYLGLPIPAEEIRLSWAKTHMSLMLIEQRDVIGRILERGYPVEWRGGLKKYSAGPSQLEGCDLYEEGSSKGNFAAEPAQLEEGSLYSSSRRNSAEPSPLELGVSHYMPSEKYIAEPSPWVDSDRWEGSSEKYAGAPSLLGYPSQKFVGAPSPRGFSVLGASKKRAEPSPSCIPLMGSRPELDWLSEPEREDGPVDSTRSPFEGDIPPWAQSGYAGTFPMKGKVFYITAYVGSGPERLKRVEKPSRTPVLGAARPVRDVGSMPSGAQFGSMFMFYPLAAIPVRHEDLEEAGPVVEYLAALIEELGAYGKILMEHRFPNVDRKEVRLQGGRWFPVNMQAPLYGGITYLNAYNLNRFYGGHEEGGWWFDAGGPVGSVPLREEDPVTVIEWEKYLRDKIGWTSQTDLNSVMGHDEFDIRPQDQFAAPFPIETPRYE